MIPPGHLWANGSLLSPDTLPAWRAGASGLAAELGDFLEEWFSPAPAIRLQSSGSTGAPKVLQVSRAQMEASARASCRFFGLAPGDSALLCLPLRYIAGKMMAVRALAGGLRLFVGNASSTPLSGWRGGAVDFAPMVPMQAIRTLQCPHGEEQLAKVRTLLLGGGFIDATLEDALQSHPSRVFASYGMTETLSHIAIRRVNGKERRASYTPLPGVRVSQSGKGTLCISAPYLGIKHLETNDLVEMEPDGSFLPLGRLDAVINSGGVKIQAEEIERDLHAATGLTLSAVPRPHPVLGQCVALLWEGDLSLEPSLRKACNGLPRYHRPLLLLHQNSLPRTETGKIDRAACTRHASAAPLPSASDRGRHLS